MKVLVCSAILLFFATGSQTLAGPRPLPTFVKERVATIKQLKGEPLGYGSLTLPASSGLNQANLKRAWVAWCDDQFVWIDVEGIISADVVESFPWEFALANDAIRFKLATNAEGTRGHDVWRNVLLLFSDGLVTKDVLVEGKGEL